MTRGSRFPVPWLALAALAWLPAAADGQLLKRAVYATRSAAGDERPTAGSPAEEDSDAGDRTSAAPRSRYPQTLAPQFDAAAGPLAPVASNTIERVPGYGTFDGEPVFGGDCGRLAPTCGLPGCLSSPPGRHRGVGHPLQRESWLYRPFSTGWFVGMVQGGPLIDDWLGLQRGFFGGYRFGWDQDYYWGGEMRFAFGSVRLYDSQRAKDAQRQADDQAGLTPTDPWRNRFDVRRDANLFQWDLSLLYYPWGDSQWRPYLLAGLGSARLHFTDRLSRSYDKVVFAMPLAAGVKYRCNDWLALRLECADNIAFGGGSGFNTVHNVSLTGGVEIRFGGSRKAYWPWNPGRHYW